MKIEAFSGHSVDECYSRIIARFKELGFELKAIEGNDLEFILHSRGFLRRSWGVIDIVLGTFAAGPLVPALLIGDYFGSRRVGKNGEILGYRLDEPVRPTVTLPKRKWWSRLW